MAFFLLSGSLILPKIYFEHNRQKGPFAEEKIKSSAPS